MEGKDGNPLNEVKALASSLLENDGVLAIEKSIRLKTETSVLGLHAGDRIALHETAFVELADAFLAEIEKKVRHLTDAEHATQPLLARRKAADPLLLVPGMAAGTGTVICPDTLRASATGAGFSGIEVLAIDHDFWRFYRLDP